MSLEEKKKRKGYVVELWFIDYLDLKGVDLAVFSFINSFTRDGETKFYGSVNYLKNTLKHSERSISQSLRNLTKRGLIIKEVQEDRTKTNKYYVDVSYLDSLYEKYEENINLEEVEKKLNRSVKNTDQKDFRSAKIASKNVNRSAKIASNRSAKIATNNNNIYNNNNIHNNKDNNSSSLDSCQIKSTSKTPKKQNQIDYDKLLKYLNKKTNRTGRSKLRVVSAKARRQFNARFKEGYLKTDIMRAIDNAVCTEYHINHNFTYLTPEFFSRSSKIDKYAFKSEKKAFKPRTKEKYINPWQADIDAENNAKNK